MLRLNTALKPPLSIGFGLILNEAFGRMGYEVIVQELPGERALKNANKGLDDGDAARIIEISETYTNLIRIPEMSLGEFTVIVSLEGVYKRLRNKVLIILGTQTIKTFLVSFCIFTIFYFLVGRHLTSLAESVKSAG